MTVYRQDANPNATNSELDAKVIIEHHTDDEKIIEELMKPKKDDIIVIDSPNSPLFP